MLEILSGDGCSKNLTSDISVPTDSDSIKPTCA